jgi:hypothetical protein
MSKLLKALEGGCGTGEFELPSAWVFTARLRLIISCLGVSWIFCVWDSTSMKLNVSSQSTSVSLLFISRYLKTTVMAETILSRFIRLDHFS